MALALALALSASSNLLCGPAMPSVHCIVPGSHGGALPFHTIKYIYARYLGTVFVPYKARREDQTRIQTTDPGISKTVESKSPHFLALVCSSSVVLAPSLPLQYSAQETWTTDADTTAI